MTQACHVIQSQSPHTFNETDQIGAQVITFSKILADRQAFLVRFRCNDVVDVLCVFKGRLAHNSISGTQSASEVEL